MQIAKSRRIGRHVTSRGPKHTHTLARHRGRVPGTMDRKLLDAATHGSLDAMAAAVKAGASVNCHTKVRKGDAHAGPLWREVSMPPEHRHACCCAASRFMCAWWYHDCAYCAVAVP